MRKCSVVGCKTNSSKDFRSKKKLGTQKKHVPVYIFPINDKEKLKKWIDNMPNVNLTVDNVTKHMGICAKHWPTNAEFRFKKGCILPDEPPSIFDKVNGDDVVNHRLKKGCILPDEPPSIFNKVNGDDVVNQTCESTPVSLEANSRVADTQDQNSWTAEDSFPITWIERARALTLQFLAEIKKRPIIWDCTMKNFNSHVLRGAAWFEVCQALNKDFDEQSTTQKTKIILQTQRRWQAHNHYYNKFQKGKKIKSGPERKWLKRYCVEDDFAFLEKTMSDKETDKEQDVRPQTHVESFLKDDMEDDEEDDLDRSRSPSLIPESAPSAMENNNATKRGRKRKLTVEEKMVSFIMNRCDEKDDDRDFFNSLLPSVRTLPEDQKLMFRSEAIMVLQRLKS